MLTRYSVIQANGQSFPEHKVESKMEGNKLIMTCYVEIQPGVPYGVCVQTQGQENDRHFEVIADGTLIDSKFFRGQASEVVKQDHHHLHIDSKPINATSFRRLQFAPLEMTDEEENCYSDAQYLMKLGEIECHMFGGKVGEVTAMKSKPSVEPHEEKPKINEKSKKATLIGAKTAFGPVETNSEPPPPPYGAPTASPSPSPIPDPPILTTCRTFFIDHSMPSQNITFKYRTRLALELLGILDQEKLPISSQQEEEEEIKPFASLNNNVKREGQKSKARALVEEDEEDELEEIKPFKKKARASSGAGSTYESAIDLTDD